MAMFVGPTHTGWNGKGWIKQPLTQEQTFLRMDLAEALKRKNDGAARIDDRRAAQSEADELVRQLKARKDQSRLGGLPPGPMPPEGDVTVIEKGAGPQPTMLPMGVAAGPERPFTPVPDDRFAQPDNTQLATSQQIRDAYDRRQSQEMPAEPMIAEAPTGVADPAMVMADQPEPAAPEPQVAYADPSPAPARVPEPTFRSGAKLPAGMRNANPGNLKYSGSAWQRRNFPGMLGPSTTHGAGNTDQGDPQIAFRSHMDGMKAAVHLARTKFRSGKNTVYSLIAGPGGWTPGYGPAANNIARNMGVGVNDPINLDNPQVMGSFMRALLLQEHGEASRAYTDDFLMAAITGGEAADPNLTDEKWISGGATRVASNPSASASPVMAYNAESTMDPTMDPQAGLVQALLAQQRAAEMGYAQPQGGGNWAPMVGPAQTELAQETPIVAGGSNVRPVSFGGGQVASPEQIDQRKAMAAALMSRGAGMQQIDHPLQGAAQVANAAAGAYGMHRAGQMEDQRRAALAQALMAAQGGGDLRQLYNIDPQAAFQLQQQRAAAAQAQQQAALQRQYELEDYERKRQIDQQYREPNEPPTSVQEYEYATKDMPPDQRPSYTEWERGNRQSGATSVSVNTGAPAEGELRKTLLKGMGESYAKAYDAGMQAEQGLLRLDNLEKNLSRTPGGLMNGLLSLASDYGIDTGDDAQSNVEAASAVIQQLVPMQRPPGSGEMSNMDVRMFQRSVPRLMNTPEGNALIIEGMRALAEYQIAHKDLIATYSQGDMSLEELNAAQKAIPNPFEGYAGAVRALGVELE